VKAQDLGQGETEEVVGVEKATEKVELGRTQTQVSGIHPEANRSTKDDINYNLINCVFILLKEQGHLWKCFVLLGIATLAGGKRATLHPRCASLMIP
jgi:ATP-binding cassette subfamily B (MDR/TAP) protein 1